MKEFEKKIILELLSEANLMKIKLPANESEIQIEHTGAGYYIGFQNHSIPKQRIVLDKPIISGYLGDVHVGFVAFIENSQFLLECYAFHERMPEDCRDNKFIPSAISNQA